MSRSFHVTKKQVEELRSKVSLDDEDHIEAYEKLCEQYSKKRRTKEFVRSERKKDVELNVQREIESVPIEFAYDSQFIHYPVTEKDIRDLLQMMPQGVVDGLTKIVFCSGTHHQNMPPKDEMYSEPQRDPYIDRIGYEVFENVYQGRCLGAYFGNQKVIRVFGYVYPHNIKLREIVEFYFRIQTLLVFLHELAHHYDFEQRTARGRWRHDNREAAEIYAEQTAHQWITGYALPYICQNYPDEYDSLNNWMKENIGIPLPISMLAGDYRGTVKKGRIRFSSFFNTANYFVEFVEMIQSQSDLACARVELADRLHMAEEYQMALKILSTVLAKDKKDIRALCVCGEIYGHLNEYPRSIQYAKKALHLDKKEVDAYIVLCDAYEGLEDWNMMLKWVCCGLEYAETKLQANLLLRRRVKAEIELKEFNEAKKTVGELKGLYQKNYTPTYVKQLESELKKRQ